MFKHWKLITSLVCFILILTAAGNLLNATSPKRKTESASSSTSSIAVAAEAGSSVSIASSSLSVSGSSSEVEDQSVKKTTVKEVYRRDGTLQSRETTTSDYRRKKKKTSVAQASRSIEIAHAVTSESSLSVATNTAASSSVEIALGDKTSSVGLGPIVWATAEGSYAGLSYRVLSVDAIQLNTSLVLGTSLLALPDLDISTGLFISKPIAPGLELGLVGTVRVPDLDRQLGLGLSYQF